ncbi:unnamed protein product, partial [Polarella glacialis]
ASYEQPDLLETALDLKGKVFMVTGANSGLGKEVATFLAAKGASVYMVCRSQARAEAAKTEIVGAAGDGACDRVHILLADCGLESDVRSCWEQFCAHRIAQDDSAVTVRLDGLLCNAGALSNTRTMTKDDIEVTFASQLLFGTYLLGTLALPCLEATPGSRLVVVSSGGMYNTPFPAWEKATNTGAAAYDGQFAYAYAKRAQVLLCEQWAVAHPTVAIVSSHPGWTSTPGVDEAYGESKSWLEPLRSTWQGAEGIIWLCLAAAEKLESGAFYLDRTPQVKHLAGPFFTEGSATKNSPAEVSDMMRLLEDWSNGRRNTKLREAAGPLQAMERPMDLPSFMGKWYVIANIPTIFDKGTTNNMENYVLDDTGNTVNVDFTFRKSGSSKDSLLKQRAAVLNEARTQWAISPKIGVYLPLRIAYLIVDRAEDYSTCIIGVPDRQGGVVIVVVVVVVAVAVIVVVVFVVFVVV